MTWTKLSDDFADDCEVLSSDAFRLHVEGLIRSNRKLLDLRLEKSRIARWVWCPEAAASAVVELLAVGWWSDEGDHYLIRHHGIYQPTREQVLAQQERNQRNGKRGGRPPKPGREQVSPFNAPVPETETHLGFKKTHRDGTGRDGQPKRAQQTNQDEGDSQ